MNLELGCREQVGRDWIYYLKDGTSMSREAWMKLVEEQVTIQGHDNVLEKIKATVQLWNKHDTVDEVALQVYASKYCTNVNAMIKQQQEFKVVQDDMGCSQLSFY